MFGGDLNRLHFKSNLPQYSGALFLASTYSFMSLFFLSHTTYNTSDLDDEGGWLLHGGFLVGNDMCGSLVWAGEQHRLVAHIH